jgi:hypothetical protein
LVILKSIEEAVTRILISDTAFHVNYYRI